MGNAYIGWGRHGSTPRREGNPLKATKHVCKDCGHKIDESELLTDNWTGEKVCKTCGAKKAFSGLRGLSTL